MKGIVQPRCFAVLILIVSACSSGKVAFEKGNYYQAVITSVDRLRKNPDHDKSAETLRQAYPLAVSYYEDRAKTSLASNAAFKWTAVVDSYTTINVMYDEIRRSPGALKVIPNPVNYHTQLQEAKQNAAEENYAAGVLALSMNTRDKAKEAYSLFIKANQFVPDYKDVQKMMEAALWAATVKVLVEPIPVISKNVSVSTEFFNDKVSEYLHTAALNKYVRFFTQQEAQKMNLKPDHILKLEFDEFAVGQVFLYEKEMKLQNDSVVVGTYVTQNLTNTGEDKVKETTPVDPKNKDEKKPVDATPPPSDQKNTDDKKTNDQQAAEDKKENNSNADKKEELDDKSNEESPIDSIAENDQVTICHVPPGNEAARHTLIISRASLKAHLAHGDTEGSCESKKGKTPAGQKGDQKQTPDKGKTEDKKGTDGKGNGASAWITPYNPIYIASANSNFSWLGYTQFDTVKIYATAKATLYYSKKTTTSKGIVSFKIIDAKTNGVLSAEKMPGEYVWISEWGYFNGDERALTTHQLQWCKQKEKVPPPPQDLFIEFTRPIYDQVVTKIQNFYKNY